LQIKGEQTKVIQKESKWNKTNLFPNLSQMAIKILDDDHQRMYTLEACNVEVWRSVALFVIDVLAQMSRSYGKILSISLFDYCTSLAFLPAES